MAPLVSQQLLASTCKLKDFLFGVIVLTCDALQRCQLLHLQCPTCWIQHIDVTQDSDRTTGDIHVWKCHQLISNRQIRVCKAQIALRSAICTHLVDSRRSLTLYCTIGVIVTLKVMGGLAVAGEFS